MRFEGIIIGLSSFLIIGALHPIVIMAEFYIGAKVWLVFLVAGLISIVTSLFWQHSIFSAIFAILGFSLLWSIHELFQQKKRVEKGWFPDNPNKKRGGDYAVQDRNNKDSFGIIVKSSRKAKSMTQSQLSGRLGITIRYLKAIGNSGRKLSYDLLARIIRELDIPTES